MNKYYDIINKVKPELVNETDNAIDFLSEELENKTTLKGNKFKLIMSRGSCGKTFLGSFAEPIYDIIDFLAEEFGFQEYIDYEHTDKNFRELVKKVKNKVKAFMPIYIYIHDSEMYSTSPIVNPHYGFDSGIYGFIYSDTATNEELTEFIKYVSDILNREHYSVHFNDGFLGGVEDINEGSMTVALNNYREELKNTILTIDELLKDKEEMKKIIKSLQDELRIYF